MYKLFLLLALVHAKEIETNWVHSSNAPEWLMRSRVERVVEHIQPKLEWDIRKIELVFYSDQQSFARSHTLGPVAIAVTNTATNTVRLGPKVNSQNFDAVFGHELVHVILFQKYKAAIPKWFEEGLANYLAQQGHVDYTWLSKQPIPPDVRALVHPYEIQDPVQIKYRYQASQALVEMIAKKCDLTNLLRLSVGEKMDSYLDTYCGIPDLNAAYRQWLKSHHS
jgi:hypothetical protein